jgi:hypothetical protein
MRLVSMHLLAIAAAALSTCLAQLAAAGQLPQKFVSVYRPAVERLKTAYTDASIKGILNVELPREGKSSQQSFILRANGERRRLDLTTLAQQGMDLEVGATEMSMATPIGSLNTYTRPDSQFFENAQQRKYAGVVEHIDRRSLMNLPYALDSSGTVLDMLLRANVKVGSVKWIRSQGEPLVEVTYQEDARHTGQSGLWNSTLVLSPQDGWALRSFTRTLAGSRPFTQRGQLEYASGPDGLPLVQSIIVETAEGTRILRREAVSVEEVKFGDPGPGWFDSFAF